MALSVNRQVQTGILNSDCQYGDKEHRKVPEQGPFCIN